MLEYPTSVLAPAFAFHQCDPALAEFRWSDRPDLADVTCNGALSAAKRMGVDAQELALRIIDGIDVPGVTFTALAGRINGVFADAWLADEAESPLVRTSTPSTYVLDFGGPNVAKPMHVGHLRSFLIGESLQRILRFNGDKVISDIHWGDFGLQMGLLVAHIQDRGIRSLRFDDFATLYPEANARAKEDPAFRILAQQKTTDIQTGKDTPLWKSIVRLSKDSLVPQIAALGVRFTLHRGESDTLDALDQAKAMLSEKGVLVESEGAWVIPMEKGPPLIFQNGEGSYLYGATDLVTISQRVEEYHPDAIVYVVDQRQAQHFKAVFEAHAKTDQPVSLEHAGFGTVNGPDGRPLKTRDGGTPLLGDLIREATDKALERNADKETARIVALAALKYADLQNRRASSYVFDLDRMISSEGKTGPYLCYQVVRMKRIFEKAKARPGNIVIETAAERKLALVLARFQETIDSAVAKREPSFLADHAYAVATAFSSVYDGAPMLESPERLALATKSYEQLTICLDLLNIEVPEVM